MSTVGFPPWTVTHDPPAGNKTAVLETFEEWHVVAFSSGDWEIWDIYNGRELLVCRGVEQNWANAKFRAFLVYSALSQPLSTGP